jgi:hypothetical protein
MFLPYVTAPVQRRRREPSERRSGTAGRLEEGLPKLRDGGDPVCRLAAEEDVELDRVRGEGYAAERLADGACDAA